MTYSEAFPLWVAEVYRNHGYEPDKWYGSEVAETLYNEAMATYNGPPATMRDYIEAIPSAEEFAYLDYAIERLRRDNISLNALSDKERWALMDKIVAEYPQYKNTRTSHAKQVQQTSMQAALDDERDVLLQAARHVAGVRLYLDDGTVLFVCYSSGVWRIFIEQEGSAPHRHKVCQETNEDDYSDEFYTEADVVRHEIASARN